MMKVFGGLYKGRNLVAPKGSNTRPSSGLVRQALFNICQGAVEGARVLDLFAGSGAIGIEALSREASFACFVEKEMMAKRSLEENLQKLDCESSAMLYFGDVFTLLPVIEKKEEPFDLIFADPPYLKEWKGKMLSQHVLEIISSSKLLKKGGTLYIEEGKEISFPETALIASPPRKYGNTYLYCFRAPL